MKVGFPTLEFQKTLLNLLDVRATVAEAGIRIKGTLREDLPFLLNIVRQTASEHCSRKAKPPCESRRGVAARVPGFEGEPARRI